MQVHKRIIHNINETLDANENKIDTNNNCEIKGKIDLFFLLENKIRKFININSEDDAEQNSQIISYENKKSENLIKQQDNFKINAKLKKHAFTKTLKHERNLIRKLINNAKLARLKRTSLVVFSIDGFNMNFIIALLMFNVIGLFAIVLHYLLKNLY